MKILFLLTLLAAMQNQTVVLDSADTQVTITTSTTGVTVQDTSYNATPGHYYIGNAQGTVPYINTQGGFTIADPELAKAIDSASKKVVFTFMSNITVAGRSLPVHIRLDAQARASKVPPS
jgi:hypothetical protein